MSTRDRDAEHSPAQLACSCNSRQNVCSRIFACDLFLPGHCVVARHYDNKQQLLAIQAPKFALACSSGGASAFTRSLIVEPAKDIAAPRPPEQHHSFTRTNLASCSTAWGSVACRWTQRNRNWLFCGWKHALFVVQESYISLPHYAGHGHEKRGTLDYTFLCSVENSVF